MKDKKKPDFLGVGPAKTGTSWMTEHLKNHPMVSCPPIKEIRFFWENHYFPNETVWMRLNKKKSWHRRYYHWYFRHRMEEYVRKPFTNLKTRTRLLWDMKYLFSVHDDDWYLSCFDQRKEFLSGEFSPQYFFLPEEAIRHTKELMPDTKVIISLRYPPDWAWSFVRMKIRGGVIKNEKKAIINDFKKFLGHGNYSKAVKLWQKYYSSDQLLIIFFDELKDSPVNLYSKICNFLNIDPVENEKTLSAKVYPGIDIQMPDKIETLMGNYWNDDMIRLRELLPDLPKAWIPDEYLNNEYDSVNHSALLNN